MLRYALLVVNAFCLFLSLVCFYIDDVLAGLGLLAVPFVSAWFWRARAEQGLDYEEMEGWMLDERSVGGWSLERRNFDRWSLFEQLWDTHEKGVKEDSSKASKFDCFSLFSIFTPKNSKKSAPKRMRKRAKKIRLGVLEREVSEESL